MFLKIVLLRRINKEVIYVFLSVLIILRKKIYFEDKKVLTKYKEANIISTWKFSGDNDKEEIPVPIPNTEVKLFSAENTCGLPCWEDKKSPDF